MDAEEADGGGRGGGGGEGGGRRGSAPIAPSAVSASAELGTINNNNIAYYRALSHLPRLLKKTEMLRCPHFFLQAVRLCNATPSAMVSVGASLRYGCWCQIALRLAPVCATVGRARASIATTRAARSTEMPGQRCSSCRPAKTSRKESGVGPPLLSHSFSLTRPRLSCPWAPRQQYSGVKVFPTRVFTHE